MRCQLLTYTLQRVHAFRVSASIESVDDPHYVFL